MTSTNDVFQRLLDLGSQDPQHLDQYVSTINVNEQTDTRIVRQILDNYFTMGQFRKATRILERSGRLDLSTHGLEDLETALLAVGRARLKLRTAYDASSVVELLRSLERLLLFEKAVDEVRGVGQHPDFALCERWIRIEAGKAALRSDLMKSGHYSRSELVAKTQFWVDKAFAILADIDDSKARGLELEMLEGFSGSSTEDRAKQARLLKALMARYPDGSREETRAIQAYAAQLGSTSAEDALACLAECGRRYSRAAYRSGQLTVECLTFSISPGVADRSSTYLELAKQFRAIGQLSAAKACIDLADTSIEHDINRWEKFLTIQAVAQPLLHEMGDHQAMHDFQLSKCVARTFASPRTPANLETATAMLTSMLGDLLPATEYSVLTCLRDCAAILRRDDEAEKLAEQAINHNYAKLDYERESALINAISMTAHTRITARYQTSLSVHQREVLYDALQAQIRQLEEYYQRDIDRRLFELAGVKLDRLIMYLNTVELKEPQNGDNARAYKEMIFMQYQKHPNIVPSAISQLFASHDRRSIVESAESNLQTLRAGSTTNSMALAEAHLLCAVSRRSLLLQNRYHLSTDTILRELVCVMDHLRQSAACLGQADNSDTSIMRATAPMLDTVYDLLQVGTARASYLSELRDFLTTVEQAMMLSREMHHSRSGALNLIESRIQETHYMRRDFYRRTADFFHRTGLLQDWWIWHERGRNRALLSQLSQSTDDAAAVATSAAASIPGQVAHGHPNLEPTSGHYGTVSTDSTFGGNNAETKVQQTLNCNLPVIGSEMLEKFRTIFQLCEKIRPKTKIVIVGFHVSLDGDIFLVVIDSLTRTSKTVGTTMTTKLVREWYESNLDDPATRLQSHPAALKTLKPLAVALESVAAKDDLLILIPTFPLDRFPLHAAVAGTQYLACRNPMLYTSSVMLLEKCLERSCSSDEASFSPALVSAYELSVEQKQIAESHVEICNRFKNSRSEAQITAARFKDRLQSSRWLHYHGHADFVDGEPLKQSFQLMPDEHTDGRVTVTELLGLRLPQSVVLSIACDSNIQDNNEANDPLGLASALIVAGAATVIGTLWKTQSPAGREYSRLVYEEIQKQIGSRSEGWLDLAEIHREAVNQLRSKRGDGNGRFNTPNDWAPFVLHGSPFFKFKLAPDSLLRQSSPGTETSRGDGVAIGD